MLVYPIVVLMDYAVFVSFPPYYFLLLIGCEACLKFNFVSSGMYMFNSVACTGT